MPPMNKNMILKAVIIYFGLLAHPILAYDFPTSRLIIGFHDKAFEELGGAVEATQFIKKNINSQWREKQSVQISLIRPIGNSAILVEVDNPTPVHIRKIISKLIQMNRIRYVNPDRQMKIMPLTNPK